MQPLLEAYREFRKITRNSYHSGKFKYFGEWSSWVDENRKNAADKYSVTVDQIKKMEKLSDSRIFSRKANE